MNRTPDWKLEKYILGELELNPSEEDLLRIEELKKENSAFLQANPYSSFEQKLKNKNIFSKIKSFLFLPKYSLSLSLVLVLIMGVFFNTNFNDTERLKGESVDRLFFYKSTNGVVSEFDTSQTIKKGDLIQISFLSSNYEYGIIFSVDGNSKSTMHYPPEEDKIYAAILPLEIKININSAYELDNAPSFETFYFVLAHNEFNIENVKSDIINKEKLDDGIIVKEYNFKKN